MSGFLLRREQILCPFLIVVFFLLNFSIATRSPFGGWMDEVSYADPGLNLAAGKGWISTAYPYQTDREFFAGTPPLYAIGLSLWAHVFGISMVSSRAYCYFLAAIGMLLLWLGTFRFNLLTPAYRLLWLIILSTEYGMNWMERNERYDVWIFLGLSLAWFGASLRSSVGKYPLIFLGCYLVPFAGLIGLPYVFLVASVAAVLTNLKFWKEALAAMIGVGSGVAGLGLFFIAFGRLQAFRECVSHMTIGQQSRLYSPFAILLFPLGDAAVGVMLGLLFALTVYCWRYPFPGSTPWVRFGWAMAILVPGVMVMRGVFVIMYFYMLIIPLSLAILQLTVLVREGGRSRFLAVAVTVLMGMLCLGGLPARLYTSWKEWDLRDPQHMRDFVRTYIHPDDVVFSDYFFYFELRDYAKFEAVPFYLFVMPIDEARQVNVVLVCNNYTPDLTQDASSMAGMGGGWKKVADFPTPEMVAKLKGAAVGKTYTLYRREVPPL